MLVYQRVSLYCHLLLLGKTILEGCMHCMQVRTVVLNSSLTGPSTSSILFSHSNLH